MSGMMMSMMNNTPPGRGVNVWTGTTTGLQMNLLNAPAVGTVWYDASGKSNNATVRTAGTGAVTYTPTTNGGLTFASGGSTNASMLSTAFNLSAPFTVEVVANITSSTFPAYLWGNENQNSSLGWWAYFYNTSFFKVGSTARENFYTITPNTGATRVFTVVCNTSPSASIDFYVNGTLQSAYTTSYGLAPSPATNGLNFNSDHPAVGTSNTPNDTGTGTFFQMRAYNIALNSTQVTANYNAVKTTYGI